MKYIILVSSIFYVSCSALVSFEEKEFNNTNNINNNTNNTNNTTTNNNNTSANNTNNNITGEICWNIGDDDGDMKSDCEDTECITDSFCSITQDCPPEKCNLISCRWDGNCSSSCQISHSYWNTNFPGNCSGDTNQYCSFDFNISSGLLYSCQEPVISGHYATCTNSCPKGAICLNNHCLTICSEDNPYCPPENIVGLDNVFCLREGNEYTATDNLGYCVFEMECNPAVNDCPDNYYCRMRKDDNQVWKTYCSAYSGKGTTGTVCNRPEDCMFGNICQGGFCKKACTIENSNCLASQICSGITEDYGICLEQ